MIAAQVDEQMQKISAGARHLDMLRVAVLTAMNIADEMNQQKEQLISLQQDAGKKEVISEQQLDKLTAELERLKQEVLSKTDQLAEGKKQRDLLQLELHALREEHRELQKEHKEQLTKVNLGTRQDDNLLTEHRKLKEEYRKLQSEYDEWVQLFQGEE